MTKNSTNKILSAAGGFTLVEITLVMAITSLLLLVALTGQHQLETRASFDADINATIQDLSYARNYALTNVNQVGTGQTLVSYTGGPITVAGAAFILDTAHANQDMGSLQTIYALYDASDNLIRYDNNPYGNAPACNAVNQSPDCAAHEEYFSSLNTTVYSMHTTGSPGSPLTSSEVLFINTGSGIKVCTAYTDTQTFANDCATSQGTIDIVISSTDGYSSTIEIDGSSGIAKRIN
jgi:Tfp pilus assembly protein FimT